MCCQPIHDSMTIAAFHMGLIDQVGALTELLRADKVLYAHGYNATELQKMMSKVDMPDFVDKKLLKAQLLRILDLAREGLKARKKGEEEYLEPLYERAEKLSNPAREMHDGLKRGMTIDYYIRKYA